VLDVLPKRLAKYGLTLHPEKTRLVDFGRPDTKAEDCLPDELDRWVRDTRTQFTKAGICRAPALPLRFGTTSAD
jgi:hypothetical protein